MVEAKVKVKKAPAKKERSTEDIVKAFRARYEMFEHPAKVRRAAECLAEVLGK